MPRPPQATVAPAAPSRPARQRPHDRAVLVLPAPPGSPDEVVRRWWYIEQPRVSVAFALQARVATALGSAGRFFLDALGVHPDDAEDYEATRKTAGEALALETLRRARAGRPLWDPESAVACSARLWAVIHEAARHSADGARLDALLLLAGEPERERGGAPDAYRWTRPSLLHQVLLASGLRFDGEGDTPKAPIAEVAAPANASDEVRKRIALRDAVALGGVGEFLRALDDITVSPDELALLSAWAVLHLWRPF